MSGIQTPTLPSCIPFPIEEEQLLDVVTKAKDWALMHGAGMRSKAAFNPNIMQVIDSNIPAVRCRPASYFNTLLNAAYRRFIPAVRSVHSDADGVSATRV